MVKFSPADYFTTRTGFCHRENLVDGKFELAASLLESYASRFGRNESIAKTERLAYLKLMEKYRNTGPFKIQPLLGKNRRADPSHGKMMDLAVEELCRGAAQFDDISATVIPRWASCRHHFTSARINTGTGMIRDFKPVWSRGSDTKISGLCTTICKSAHSTRLSEKRRIRS